MKNLLLALLLVSTSASAQFLYNYEVLCAETDGIIKRLTDDEFSEKLTWTGTDIEEQSMFSLWTNSKTGTWTLLKMSQSRVSCIIGAGTDSKFQSEII